MIEQTVVMLKPAGVPHFDEAKKIILGLGLSIPDEQLLILTEGQTRVHYRKYVKEPFFPDMLNMMENPVWPILVEGEDAIRKIRKEFMPIFRGKYRKSVTDNSCNCSDPEEDPRFEVAFFFGKNGVVHLWRKKHHLAA